MAGEGSLPISLDHDGNLVVGVPLGPSITFSRDSLTLRGESPEQVVSYGSIRIFGVFISKDLARRRNRIVDSVLNVILIGGFNLSRYNGEYLSCALDAQAIQADLTLGRLPDGRPPRWFGAAISAYFEFLENGHNIAMVSGDPQGVISDLMRCRSRSRWRASVNAEKFAAGRLRAAGGK